MAIHMTGTVREMEQQERATLEALITWKQQATRRLAAWEVIGHALLRVDETCGWLDDVAREMERLANEARMLLVGTLPC